MYGILVLVLIYFQGSVFVLFVTKEPAEKFVAEKDLKYEGQEEPLKIMLKYVHLDLSVNLLIKNCQ